MANWIKLIIEIIAEASQLLFGVAFMIGGMRKKHWTWVGIGLILIATIGDPHG